MKKEDKLNKKEEPKSSRKDVTKNKSANKGKHKTQKKPLKERNKFLYYITIPFTYIYAIITALLICLWYYILQPIYNFCIKNYKHIWNWFILSMIILNVIFTLRATERNRHNIDKYNEKLDNITQMLQEYQAQCETLQQELNQYKDDQLAIQEETSERLDSLNKKVTSRSANERSVSSNTTTQPKSELQEYAHNLVINEYGWTEEDFTCLVNLWNRESGWNPNAHNSSSGAHGIPQSLPASKMASEGDDYYTNGETQIRWGLKYIAGRYGSPSNAWAHFQNKNWY